MSKKEIKNRNMSIYKFEFIFIMLLVVIVIVSLKPNIGGLLPATSFRQNLNIELSKSQIFYLQSTDGKEIKFSSFSISGEIIGSSHVTIYLDNKERKLLVFSNVVKRERFGLPITGMVTDINENETGLIVKPGERIIVPYDFEIRKGQASEGTFIDECEQTCNIPADFYKPKYDLVVLIEPGTIVRITDIVYVVV